MTANCNFELQKALYVLLTGDGELMGQISGVFNHVPQDTAFPYVIIEKMVSQDHSTMTSTAEEIAVTLSVFSRTRGSKEALTIMARVKALLHQASLSLTGCALIYLRFDSSDIAQVEEGLTWQATITFNALIEED